MSNFSGNVRKNASSFKPQQRAGDGAGVGRVVGGVYAGQDTPIVFTKADDPVLPTDATPRTDGAGESEMGLRGQVDHPNRDGQAQYLASKIARVYRRIVADGAEIANLSRAERRALADKLIEGVYDGDGQHPSGEAGSKSQADALQYVRQVASLLFGLIDELPGTPEFLRAPKPPTPDSDRVGRIGADYLKPVSKSANSVEVDCPFCHKGNHVERGSVGGLQKVSCDHCGGNWQQDLNLSTFTKSEPTLADLRKQLAILTERLRGIIARDGWAHDRVHREQREQVRHQGCRQRERPEATHQAGAG